MFGGALSRGHIAPSGHRGNRVVISKMGGCGAALAGSPEHEHDGRSY